MKDLNPQVQETQCILNRENKQVNKNPCVDISTLHKDGGGEGCALIFSRENSKISTHC